MEFEKTSSAMDNSTIDAVDELEAKKSVVEGYGIVSVCTDSIPSFVCKKNPPLETVHEKEELSDDTSCGDQEKEELQSSAHVSDAKINSADNTNVPSFEGMSKLDEIQPETKSVFVDIVNGDVGGIEEVKQNVNVDDSKSSDESDSLVIESRASSDKSQSDIVIDEKEKENSVENEVKNDADRIDHDVKCIGKIDQSVSNSVDDSDSLCSPEVITTALDDNTSSESREAELIDVSIDLKDCEKESTTARQDDEFDQKNNEIESMDIDFNSKNEKDSNDSRLYPIDKIIDSDVDNAKDSKIVESNSKLEDALKEEISVELIEKGGLY